MTSLKKLVQGVKILAVILTCSVLLFLQNAIAEETLSFSIDVKGSQFIITPVTGTLDKKLRISSAVVSLPENETGIIDKIIITGPNGEREFGCVNLKVTNGTDLIKSCGGPAYLNVGNNTYEAQGSKFEPKCNFKLGIKLTQDVSTAL